MALRPEAVSPTNSSLQELLTLHIETALTRSASNTRYAEATREKAAQLDDLIANQEGTIRGLVIGWMSDVQPFAEKVFGLSLESHPIGGLGGEAGTYFPTVFDGVLGRVKIISTDEIWGPTLSLDLIGQKDLDRLQN